MRNNRNLSLTSGIILCLMACLGGCTFRPPGTECTTSWGEEKGTPSNRSAATPSQTRTKAGAPAQAIAGNAGLDSLRDKIADLEKRLADNEKLAQDANSTADKALKCCRKDYTILMTEEVYFDFNKYDLTAESKATLDKISAKLKSDPDLIAEMGGHCDSVGTSDYNIVLGQKRADAARQYLVGTGSINYGRLAIRTFGREAAANTPKADVTSRKKDRRVTIDILGYAQ
ncbi:MAG: OmpA family protein [candidate division Zixibacteria bacterium]|nr:OmpA family protein [candidate division Zixibacteria bacterium]